MAQYWVSPTGSDAAAGTETAPWKTISIALGRMADGDTLWLQDGNYAQVTNLPARANATDYIHIKAVNPHQAVIVTLASQGGFQIKEEGSRYIHIDGIDFRCYFGIYQYYTMGSLEHFICENVTLHYPGCVRGILMHGPGEDWTFRNVIHDGTPQGMIIGIENEGSPIDGILIEDCESRNCTHAQLTNTDGFCLDNNTLNATIRRCTAYGSKDSGFDIKTPAANISSCIAYDNGAQGFKIWGLGATVYNCLAYSNDWAGFAMVNDNQTLDQCTSTNNGNIGDYVGQWLSALPQGVHPDTQTFSNCILVGGMRNHYPQTAKIVPTRCLFYPVENASQTFYQSKVQVSTYTQWLADPTLLPTTNCAYGDPLLGPDHMPAAGSPALTMAADGTAIGYLGTITNARYDAAAEAFLAGTLDWEDDTIKAVAVTNAYTWSAGHATLEDVAAAARIATVEVPDRTVTGGVLRHSTLTWADVAAGPTVNAVVYYRDGATEADTLLIQYMDAAWGMPIETNGSDLIYIPDDGRLCTL